ncbi:Hypothetical protein SMAX5B_021823 [Scophthalmus maximus]|uniref:Uncharacterized protein n=1 Tax=Scophthalmus maximus TaxID=52904 RepID=A0A2U9BI01_SCOMX|nr:Hypothetical protein SMAX5B_021823 [Scophthalmus maximus]KAF0035387.1 hypothetical protein F2P81_013145 [Scophthalmus maximus]
MIALFSTILTDRFIREYEVVDRGRVPVTSCQSWTTRIVRTADEIRFRGRAAPLGLAEFENRASVVQDATLKSAAAVSTLFESCEAKIQRFVKKMVCKHNDKHACREDFYTAVIMVTLCLFPYLKHRALGELFSNRTLVLMCFDKTRTRHSQWSALATRVHLHVNQPGFAQRLAKSDLRRHLPSVVTATLGEYISRAA